MAELRQRRRQGRIEYKQPDGSWSTKKPPENPRRTQARAKQAEAAKGTKGPDRVGQPAGTANRKYGANRVNAAVSRAQRSAAARSATKLAGRVTLPLAIVNQIADIARVAKENQRFSKYKKEQESKKAAQSGQYGRYGQPSSQVKSEKSKSTPDKPAPKATPKPAAKPKPTAAKPKPTPAKPKPTAAKPAASKPASAPKSDKKRKSIADTLKELKKMKRASKERQGVEDKAKGTRKAGKQYGSKAMSSGKTGASVDPGYTPRTSVKANYADKQPANRTSTAYSNAAKKLSKPAQKAKPAQAAKPNAKSKLRQAMEERMKKRRGRGY